MICLDVLRAVAKYPRCVEALAAELAPALRRNEHLDAAYARLMDALHPDENAESRSRELAQSIALIVQAALLVRRAPDFVADAFCATRLAPAAFGGGAFGARTAGRDAAALVERALPG